MVDLLKSNEQRQLQSEKEQQQRYINYSQNLNQRMQHYNEYMAQTETQKQKKLQDWQQKNEQEF